MYVSNSILRTRIRGNRVSELGLRSILSGLVIPSDNRTTPQLGYLYVLVSAM